MKILVFVWILGINFILGGCIYALIWNESYSHKKFNMPAISLKQILQYNPGNIKLNNTNLVKFDNKEIEMRYHCSVTEGVSLPHNWARGGHAGGLINGNIIVAGGTNWSEDKTTKFWLNSSAVFKDGSWIEGPELPKPLAYPMYGYDDSGLYVAGGSNDGISVSKDVYMLHSLKDEREWRVLPQLPEAVSYGAGVVFKGKFYVTCGSLGNEQTNKMWCLDINHIENGWTECKPVPGIGRMFPAFVACGEYLYLIGGLEEISPLKPLNDIYRYYPVKDEWTRLKDLPLKGYAWVSQPIDDNHFLLTGRADGSIYDGIWIVDLENSSMQEIGNLVIPTATAPLVEVADKCFWLIGGEPDANKNRTEKVSVINVNPIKK